MSKIRLNVNSKFQFKSKFGIKINQYSNYVDTLEVKFDYVFKTSYPAIYLYVERNDKSSNTLYSTQLILNQESNCYEYQFGSNDGDINGSWFTAIPGPLKVSFEIIDGDDKFTTDKYSIWINGSVTASNDKITLNANEFNNIINFIQEISDSKLSKSEYDINKNWYDVEEDFADNCITEVMHENGKRKIFFTSIGDEPTRYEAIGLVNQQNGTYYCVVYSPTGTSLYKRTSSDDYVTKINYKTSTTIFESEGATPPIHLKSDMPYVVSDTPHKVGMRAYTEDGQMAGQFAVTYDEEYSGHFANMQARCSEDEIHTFRVSHKGPTYHITKGKTKEVHNIPFDENVVHNSGDETIGGRKTFERPISLKEVRNVNGKMQTQIDVKNSSYDKVGEIRFYKENSTQRNAVIIAQNDTDENITYKELGIDDYGVWYSNDYTSQRLATENDIAEAIINKADKSEVPTKTSDLNNDSGFIDRLVTNLANYYLKDETYSKEEITKLLGNISKIAFIPVDSLPEVGEEQVIYLVPKDDGVSPDIRDEYIYINGSWEIIGSTKIDLSNYLTIEKGDEKYALNTNTFSFAEVAVNTPKSLTIKDIYDSIQSQLPNQNSDVILLRITGYLGFTGFAEIRYVGAYLTSLYSFKDNKFVSNYYSSDTYIDDILNSLSSNVDVSSDQEISGTKIFNILKAASILINDKEVALKEDIPTDYVDLTSEQTVEAFKDFIAGIGINGIKILKDSSDRIVFYFGSTPKVKIGQLDTLFANRLTPDASNTYDIGRSGVYWRDLYLSGYLTDGTNSVAVSNIAQKNDFKTINGESIYGEGDIKIEGGSGENFKYVSALPTTDISTNTIYVVRESGGVSPNVYNEYIYINEKWEKIGGSDFIDKTSNQAISGTKSFSKIHIDGGIYFYNSEASTYKRMISLIGSYLNISQDLQVYNLFPEISNYYDLGNAVKKWKDLYIGGVLTDGTNSISIADIANKSSLSEENLVSIIGSATTELTGLMSSTDKERLDTLVALLKDDDENTIVDTIAEVLAIFNQYPEGADLVSTLALKADKSEIVDLTTPQTITSNKTIAYGNRTNYAINSGNLYGIGGNQYNYLQIDYNGAGMYSFGTKQFFPNSNNSRDLGTSSLMWKDLYLSGTISNGTYSVTISDIAKKSDIPTDYIDLTSAQEISGVKTFSTIKVKHADKDNFFQISPDSNGYNVKFSFGNSVLMMLHNGGITNYRDILPDTNGTRNLGSTSALFKNLYISGYLSDGTNSITVAQIVDKLNNINLSREQLVSTIGEATSTLSGLMSAEDKTNLDTLVSLLSAEEDENVVVDRINEILSIFNQYPEGADLVSALALKADKKDIPTDYVDLNSTQNIAGAKSFSRSITRGPKQEGQSGYVDIGAPGAGNSFDRGYITYLNAPISMVTFKPQYDNSLDLGGSNGRWKDLYLSGVLTDNTNSIAIADIANKNDIPKFKTINGESIVGEGNIKIETRPLKEYVQAGVTEKQLEPNKYYIFDSQVASNITITLAEEDDTYLDEFMGEIKVDESPINITFPNIIRWNDNGNVTNTDGVLTLEAKNTYLFSVANSLGLITNIPNPSLEKPVTTLTDGILTWEEVEGAQKYEMHYNSELKTTVNSGETLSINVKSILDQYAIGGATFTFVLKALSNYYTDSSVTLTYDKIVQLATPKNLVLSETTLSWDAVDFADSYEVYVGTTKATTVTNNYVDLSTLTGYTGTYDISVKAINASKPSVHLTSDSSETVSYTWEAAA